MNHYKFILVERNEKVGLITINRPKQLNAINDEVSTELVDALRTFDCDDDIASIVIHGEAKCFAAGADIKHIAKLNYEQAVRSDFAYTISQISSIRKPIIAAVSGIAFGAGTEIALMCDIVITSETAVFALPEVTLGVIPGAGGAARLSRAIGKSKAMYYTLTGKSFNAKEAQEMGISAMNYPVEHYFEEAMGIARGIANNPQLAVVAAKEAINQQTETPLIPGLKHERALFYSLFGTSDQKEGMAAFIEKRKANFN